MNHNAYYIKNANDTVYRNLESYFTKCNVSVSEIKGFLEVGDAKNIIIEDYDDNVESQILLPSDGIIVYKDVDFSIKLLIEGNSTYKVTEQMNDIIAYFEKSPTIIKDNYRMHGNKIVLLGWQQNQLQLNNSTASTSEYMLLNLKFKKLFSQDIPFINVGSGTFDEDCQAQTDNIEVIFNILDSRLNNQFLTEIGFYMKKSTDPTYTKYVSTMNYSYISKIVNGLTSATKYNIYPYITTKLETIVGSVVNITTL